MLKKHISRVILGVGVSYLILLLSFLCVGTTSFHFKRKTTAVTNKITCTLKKLKKKRVSSAQRWKISWMPFVIKHSGDCANSYDHYQNHYLLLQRVINLTTQHNLIFFFIINLFLDSCYHEGKPLQNVCFYHVCCGQCASCSHCRSTHSCWKLHWN